MREQSLSVTRSLNGRVFRRNMFAHFYPQGNISMITRNMGVLDRGLRAVVGLLLISLVFVGPQTAWGWIGLVPLATAALGFCPAYAPFGIRTCPRRAE